MAQLRQEQNEFIDRGVTVLIIGPDGPNAFKRFWEAEEMPFVGLADIRSKVADEFAQEVNLLKLGRMPAMFIVDQQGIFRYVHYATAMSDIPETKDILKVLDRIQT